MGREWAHICYRAGVELSTFGNSTHDEAARKEYALLKK